MEDLPYLSENHNQQPQILQSLARNVTALEDYLRCGIYDQDYCDELLDAVKDDVGEEGQDKTSSLRAFGYALDHTDTLIPNLTVIDAAVAYRHEVEIRPVGDDARVLIHYEVFDDEGILSSYYVPPLAVLSNAREADTLQAIRSHHHVLKLIDDNASIARQKIFISDFFRTDRDGQYDILTDVASDLTDSLGVEYGADIPVSIGVHGYYQVPSDIDIQTIKWKDYYHQVPAVGEESLYMLDGVIFNAVYLEVLNGLSEKISSTDDLNLGYGLPCVILIDQSNASVYYIPAVDIVSFHSDSDTL